MCGQCRHAMAPRRKRKRTTTRRQPRRRRIKGGAVPFIVDVQKRLSVVDGQGYVEDSFQSRSKVRQTTGGRL